MEYKTATGQDYMQPAQEPSLKLSCHFFQTLIWAYLLLVGSRIHSAPRRMPTTSLCKLQHAPKKCWHAWTRLSLMRRFLASYYGLRIAEIKQCLESKAAKNVAMAAPMLALSASPGGESATSSEPAGATKEAMYPTGPKGRLETTTQREAREAHNLRMKFNRSFESPLAALKI